MRVILACLVMLAGLAASVCHAAGAPANDVSAVAAGDDEKLPDRNNPANLRIIVHAVTAKSIYGIATKFELTDAVYLVKTRGKRSLIRSMETIDEDAGDPVWVPNDYLAGLSAFKPLDAWGGATHCQFTSGDAVLTYDINADGSFRLNDPQWWAHGRRLNPQDMRSENHTGRLYRAGEVVWARTLDTESDDFWFSRNKFALVKGRLYSVWFGKYCEK